MADPLLFLALDVPDGKSAMDLLTRIGKESLTHVKVGLELFMAEGPGFVRSLVLQGYQVALDIKLDDIPETVERTCRQVAALGAHYVMAHVGGGRKMLEAAVRGVGDSGTKVLAVTVLTSLEVPDLAEIGVITGSVEILVVQRALLAKEAGCHGVIASPKEVKAIRAAVGAGFLIITPGVRPAGAATQDQKRTGTAYGTIVDGGDGVVVGRPIRDAADPLSVVMSLRDEMQTALVIW